MSQFYIFYRNVFFDKNFSPVTYPLTKRAKILYICQLETLNKLVFDIPISLQNQELIIDSIYQKAYESNLIDSSHTYSLYFSCKQHFYDEALQECEAYFLDHSLFTKLPKNLTIADVAIDACIFATQIEQGFVYFQETQLLCYIKNFQILSTFIVPKSQLAQKTQLFETMFGTHKLHIVESINNTTLLQCALQIFTHMRQNKIRNIIQSCRNELISYKQALLHNKIIFTQNAFALFQKPRIHFIRNITLTLAICIALIYPSTLYAHMQLLQNQILTLQNKEYDFLSLENSTNTKTKELHHLLSRNQEMYQKVSFVLSFLNAPPLSQHIQEVFALLQQHSVNVTDVSFAKATGFNVATMDISAPTQSHIAQLLKSLNTQKNQAKITHITHKDNKAHSRILVVCYE